MSELSPEFHDLLSTAEGVEAFDKAQQAIKLVLDAAGPPQTSTVEEGIK